MFLKIRTIISKKRSNVTDFAAMKQVLCKSISINLLELMDMYTGYELTYPVHLSVPIDFANTQENEGV